MAQVTNVAQDQIQDTSGNLVDVYDITFTVPGSTGTFTVQVPTAGDPVAAAQEAIGAVEQQVAGILAL